MQIARLLRIFKLFRYSRFSYATYNLRTSSFDPRENRREIDRKASIILNIYRTLHFYSSFSCNVRFQEARKRTKVPVIRCLISRFLFISYFRTRSSVPRDSGLHDCRGALRVSPSFRHPSPFVPVLPVHIPRSSCTWHAAVPFGRRRAATAGRPLRVPSTVETGCGGTLVRGALVRRLRTRHVRDPL